MPSLHEQIRALLDEGKTQEALDLFSKTGLLEAPLMQARYDRLAQDQAEGRGNAEDWRIERNRIHFALLEITKPETETAPPSADTRRQTSERVASGATAPSPIPQIEPAQKISQPEAAPLIRKAVQQGNLDEAIHLLFRAGAKEAEWLYKQYSVAKRQNALGVLAAEDWGRVKAQLSASILGLGWLKESEMPETKVSDATKSQISAQLGQQNLEEALALCENLGDSFLLLQSRFKSAKKQWNLGLMDAASFETVQSQIGQALREILGETPDQKARKGGLVDRLKLLFT